MSLLRMDVCDWVPKKRLKLCSSMVMNVVVGQEGNQSCPIPLSGYN